MRGMNTHQSHSIKINPATTDRILNGPRAVAKLDKLALAAKAYAEAEWEIRSRDQGKAPIYYGESFKIRRAKDKFGRATRRLVNTDPEWFFVEFGVGHGKGLPGYKYRIFGHTLDALAAGGIL